MLRVAYNDDSDQREGRELKLKPLMRVKVRTTDSCIIECGEIEAKLKGLVVSQG